MRLKATTAIATTNDHIAATMTFGLGGWKRNFTADKIPNLQGKVAVVTGANGGLGAKTATELALSGAKVCVAQAACDRDGASC